MRKTTYALVCLAVLGCQGTFTQIDQGNVGRYRNAQDAFLVVRDAVAWQFLHSWTHQNTVPAPAVNFGTDVVAGVLLGTRPTSGYSVGFSAADFSDGSAVTLDVSETAPAPGTIVLMVLTKPYAFARVTRHDGAVFFHKNGATLVPGVEKTYPGLVTEDFLDRKAAYQASNTDWPVATAPPQAASLPSGTVHTCPLDGTQLVAATLPASGQYTDLANKAYFCPVDSKYWVLHTQGAFVGTVSMWWGPFAPGQY